MIRSSADSPSARKGLARVEYEPYCQHVLNRSLDAELGIYHAFSHEIDQSLLHLDYISYTVQAIDAKFIQYGL